MVIFNSFLYVYQRILQAVHVAVKLSDSTTVQYVRPSRSLDTLVPERPGKQHGLKARANHAKHSAGPGAMEKPRSTRIKAIRPVVQFTTAFIEFTRPVFFNVAMENHHD